MREEHDERTFYTALEYFEDRYDAIGRQLGLEAGSVEECLVWQAEVRSRLRHITGIERMITCDPEPEVTCIEEMDGYTRERVVIQTEPGVSMPLYVLVPQGDPGQRYPSMLAPHGHGSGGKYSPAGRTDIPAIAKQVEAHNYAYGVEFVKAGFVTFCPDARGFGERREWMMQRETDDALIGSSCQYLNHMAIPLGQTVTGMWTWDLMRLLDYAQSRAECDPERIGCAGLSGGGLQTLWLAALDDRVKCAVVSGYFYGYKDSLLKLSTNCSCNYVPGLWELVDMGDIGALIAPRPLLIETGSQDPLNGEGGVENARSQCRIARRAYELFGVEDGIVHHVFEGEHMWDGTGTVEWIRSSMGRS